MTFFALSEEQKMLQEACASFIESTLPLEAVRRLVDGHVELDRGYLDQAAELGFFALLAPERYGGASVSDRPVRDLAIIAEQRGRHLQPGPFTGTHVAAASLTEAGSAAQQEEWLPRIAAGRAHVSWLAGVDGREDGDGVILDGVAARGEEAGAAALLLVTVSMDGGPRHFLVPKDSDGIAIAPLETFDLTGRLDEVRFAGARLPAAAELVPRDSVALAERQLSLAALLTVVDAVGVMGRLFELTLEYAKVREAFGRTIGSFQAVKHQLADASMLLRASMAAAAAATDALAEDHPDADEIASIAKAFVGEAGLQVGQTCLQVHGGIGYAWEHDLHLFLRRLSAAALRFGDARSHRARVARIHGLGAWT
jgi:alkylation response protein AidB-like acyl-CoA dehydrogenase